MNRANREQIIENIRRDIRKNSTTINVENVTTLLEHFRRINTSEFYMNHWQKVGSTRTFYNNYEEFHTCGNTACVAGHMALLPEFHRDGGTDRNGMPILDTPGGYYIGEDAFAYWTGLPLDLAEALCMGDYPDSYTLWLRDLDDFTEDQYEKMASKALFPVLWEDAQVEHVICILEMALEAASKGEL